MFAKFGIPKEVIFDGGCQFSFFAFQNFAKCYGFYHTLISLRYAQSNEEAVEAVQIVKNPLKKLLDPNLALFAY